MEKIGRIEDQFRSAYNFAHSETGAGIESSPGTECFQDLVRKKCLYYNELFDIMADRSSTTPKATNLDPSFLDEEEESSSSTDDDNNNIQLNQPTATNNLTIEDELQRH